MLSPKIASGFLYFLGLAGLIAIGVSFFNQLACEGQLLYFYTPPTAEQQIWGEQVIGQSFIAPQDNLNRVEVRMQTYRRKNVHEVTFQLMELSGNANEQAQAVEVFKATFDAASVADQRWRAFNFRPIPDSKGKTYLFTLHSPAAGPGNAITVNGVEKDSYRPGSAFLGTSPVLADLTFRACFEMTAGEKLQVWINQMTHHRSGLWGNAIFYWIVLGVYVVLAAGFFWKLTSFSLR